MQVSSAEQEVSCSGSSMQGHFDAIAELINSSSISNADRCLHTLPIMVACMHVSVFDAITEHINNSSISNADRSGPALPLKVASMHVRAF